MEVAYEAIINPLGLAISGVAAILIYVSYRFLVSPYRVLSNHGIKGPKPLPIVGNYLSIRKKGLLPFTEEQIKKFGPVVGFYIGADPRIAVVDLELAKDIMVKNFDHFSDRGYLGGPNTAPKALNVSPGLLVATGETWKTGRHAFTPSFSGMKMKLMVPLIKRSSDVLLEKMGKFAQSEKTVEIFREYGSFTIETLIATAFGRYIDVQQGEEADELVKAAEIIFTASQEGAAFDFNVAIVIHSIIPWIMPLSYGIIRRSYIGKALYTVHMTARELIRERIESQQPPKVKDFLQLMIDSTVDESGNKTTTISSEQITAFAVDFLMAGYETTANTLSYTSYLLAMNTDVQDKLQEEIDNYFEENPEVSLYDAAQKLKYLDMVIQESMRFYTPVPFAARHCSKTVTLGNVTIPEGSGIIIPLNIIHHLPEYWPDPYKFDPERFTPEAKAGRHQLAHMPFGWGPRNCIGVRFALLELKIALMEILRKYSFARGPETPAHLELVHGITSVPKNGIMIKIVARS